MSGQGNHKGEQLENVDMSDAVIRNSNLARITLHPLGSADHEIVLVDGQPQLVISGGDYVTGHDLETGRERWRLGGFNPSKNPFNRIISSARTVGPERRRHSRSASGDPGRARDCTGASTSVPAG